MKLSHLIKCLKIFIYAKIEAHDCPHCGSMIMDKNDRYMSRGYNHLCRQACGSLGWFCDSCNKVHYKKTDEEFLDTLPNWCSYKGHLGRGEKMNFTDYNEEVLRLERKYAK
jgi:hypothetical protein